MHFQNLVALLLASSLVPLTVAIGCSSDPTCHDFAWDPSRDPAPPPDPRKFANPLERLFSFLQTLPADIELRNDKAIACVPGAIIPPPPSEGPQEIKCASLCAYVKGGIGVDKGELMSAASYLLWGHGCNKCGEAKLWSQCKHRQIENGILSVGVHTYATEQGQCPKGPCAGLCRYYSAAEDQEHEVQAEL
jgi:hypothetical protein